MKGEEDRKPARTSSRSPMKELSRNSQHHQSQTLHHVNGHDCPTTNGKSTPTHHSQTKSLKNTQHRAISSECGDSTSPGKTKTNSQFAREQMESQELYKSADVKAGVDTVVTRRVLKKTTTITHGENEKVGLLHISTLFSFLYLIFHSFRHMYNLH